MWKRPPERCQLFFFYSMLFSPADMNATTAASSRGVEPRLGVPLQSFCCIGVAVKTPPHCLTAWSHLAERLFMGAIPASESFFSSVLSWSVRVDAQTHPHWHDFFYLSADHERWHCSHPKPCLFISEWPHRCYLGYCVWHAVASPSQSLNIQYLLF